MTCWTLSEPDIDRIGLGAGVLGTGGGGNSYLGMLMAKAQLREGRSIKIIRAKDLAPEALVLAIGGIGAPTVGIEKMEEGGEGVRLVAAVERLTGQRISALIADEIGGANALAPMITAAMLGLPVVDADGMGRAFPEVQMTSFFIHGHAPAPACLADSEGNVLIVTKASSPEMLEKILRAGTVAMGCTAEMSTAPMTADFVQRYAVPLTVSQAWRIGDTVLSARAAKTDPVAAVVAQEGGKLLLRGKVTDIARDIVGGFVRGKLTISGLESFSGQTAEIDIQNEYLVVRSEGQILAMVPDLVCILDSESGRPIGTEEQRYGLRVSVIVIPAPAILRSTVALQSVGPRAFGYDHDFNPTLLPKIPLAAPGYYTQPKHTKTQAPWKGDQS